MKLLVALFLILTSSWAFAGPGDGPIVPWPTSVNRQDLLFEDLKGEWVAYSHNSLWFIKIEYDYSSPEGLAKIEVKSSELFTSYAVGWLQSWNRIYWGELVMDKNHKVTFIAYKDAEGTKIRIGKDSRQYFDLKLYRK